MTDKEVLPPFDVYRLRIDLGTGETSDLPRLLNPSYAHTLSRELHLLKQRGSRYVLIQEAGENALNFEAYLGYFRLLAAGEDKWRLVRLYLRKDVRQFAKNLYRDLADWIPGRLVVAEELEPVVKELIG